MNWNAIRQKPFELTLFLGFSFWFLFFIGYFLLNLNIPFLWFSMWSLALASSIFMAVQDQFKSFFSAFKKGMLYGILYSAIILVGLFFWFFFQPEFLNQLQQDRLLQFSEYSQLSTLSLEEKEKMYIQVKEGLELFFSKKMIFSLCFMAHLLMCTLYSLVSSLMVKKFFSKKLAY